jgi:hypothetical protein
MSCLAKTSSKGRRSRRTIIVDSVSGGLLFTIVDELHRVDSGLSPISNIAALQQHVQSAAPQIDGLSQKVYQSEEGRSAQRIWIEGFGRGLFMRVFPAQLQDSIRRWPTDAWVGVSSSEDWIPWELLNDGAGFLGDRFRLYRIPRCGSGRRPSRRQTTISRDRAIRRTIVHVLGGDLEHWAERCGRLVEKLKSYAAVKPAAKIMVSDLIALVGDADIVHLTCHGRRQPFSLQISNNVDATVNLTADSLALIDLKPASLLFANACGSALTSSVFGESLSFGWAVYAKGAFYIGTLGAVGVDLALSFAELFYENLAVSGDLFDAFMKTKRDLGGPEKNFGALLYCIYANPVEAARFSFTQNR